MIKAEIVLRAPEFHPQVQLHGSAGADLKVYVKQDAYGPENKLSAIDLAGTAKERLAEMVYAYYSSKLYINGGRFVKPRELSVEEALIKTLGECYQVYVEEGAEQVVGEFIMLPPGKQFVFDVGFKLALWSDLENKVASFWIVPRSGLACKYLVGVANSPGIGDENYRGWVGACLENRSNDYHVFTHGSRVAQMLHLEVEDQSREGYYTVVEELGSTNRGASGFGSTGV